MVLFGIVSLEEIFVFVLDGFFFFNGLGDLEFVVYVIEMI